MSVAVTLLDLLCTFNEIYWLFGWVDLFLSKRSYVVNKQIHKKGLYPGIYLACVVTVFLMNRITLTSPYTAPMLLGISVIVIMTFWKCDIAQTIALVGTYFLMLFVKGNMEISMFGLLGGEKLIQEACFELGLPRMGMLAISGVSLLLINYLLLRWAKKKEIAKFDNKNIAILALLGFFGSIFMGKMFLDSFQISLAVIWYLLLIIAVLILYLLYYMMKSQGIRFKASALEMQNVLLTKYYSEVDENYKRKSKLYHEMNHHLHTLYSMLQMEQSEEAKQYIQSIGAIGELSQAKTYVGIGLIDAILNEYAVKAEQKSVEFNVKAQILPMDISFSKSDLCSLFSNLLENALEAAKEKINVHIKRVGRILYIKIENDTDILPVQKSKHLITSKKDRNVHGWGTQIVEDIVEKYEGDIEYSYNQGSFSVGIMINEKIEE